MFYNVMRILGGLIRSYTNNIFTQKGTILKHKWDSPGLLANLLNRKKPPVNFFIGIIPVLCKIFLF
jgi:hypothetical protein